MYLRKRFALAEAVPVNLAYAVGRSLVALLNDIEKLDGANKPLKKGNTKQ